MSAISKLTRRSSSAASKRSRKGRHRRSRSGSPALEEAGESSLISAKGRFRCTEDVVDFFVDQMLDAIVDTYAPMECFDLCSCPIDDYEESRSSLKMKDFRDVNSEDLKSAEVVSVKGSVVVLKKKRKGLKSNTSSSLVQKSSTSGNLSKISVKNQKPPKPPQEGSALLFRSSVQSSSKWSSSFGLSFPDEEDFPIHIVFNNGNVYEGFVRNKLMHGIGKYMWVDGTIYEGEFKDGFPTGKGIMTLPELSYYEGDFCNGLFHGEGVLNIVTTPLLYSGGWNHGKKSGKGWLLYGAGDYYEGDWAKDLMEGSGLRQYSNEAKYKGMFSGSLRNGFGVTQWRNGDFYRGEWLDGNYSGYGEYFWGTFKNDTFTFYPQNVYKGEWSEGKRHGVGTLYFGNCNGSHYRGNFDRNFKHGDGSLICGNGKTIEKPQLFLCDKLAVADGSGSVDSYANLPIFGTPESVEIGHYIDVFLLNKIRDFDSDKLAILKDYEEITLRNTLILYMPQLRDLYAKYSNLGKLVHEAPIIEEAFSKDLEPVMIRLFLWQFYRDIEIWKYNSISLVDTDMIFAQNPTSCVRNVHNPFEYIYFWQFILSLIGVILATISLEDQVDFKHGGVCSFVVRRFLDDLKENFVAKSPPSFKFKDLVPIRGVYALYQNFGEPLTAKELLRKTCLKKRDQPPCSLELQTPPLEELKLIRGVNSVPLFEEIRFRNTKVPGDDGDGPKNWSNLYDFRHLKIRNIMNCLSEVCPLIKRNGVIANLDYTMTFLEFYDVLLNCIFKLIELELKHEKKLLMKVDNNNEPEENKKHKTKPAKKAASEKSSAKTLGKSNKKRKR